MYNEFYGFAEKPFELLPDLRFLFLTPGHRETIASIIDGIRNRRGFISITGEVGTGKTMLSRFLLGKLEVEEKVKTVLIFHPTITFKELLTNILLESDLEVKNANKKALLLQFNEYLNQMIAKDENLVIIIDEAQDLSKEVMGELGMLPKLRALQVVFVGQPEFEDKLNSQGMRQLKQRTGIRCQIKILSEKESKDYIDHRLGMVRSSSSQTFTSKALSMICSHAKGIPRIINLLCDNAFLMGYNLGQKKIDVDMVREIIKDMERPFPQKTSLSQVVTAVNGFHLFPPRLNFLLSKLSLIVLSFLCLGGFILLIDRYFQAKPAKTLDIKSPNSSYVDTKPSLTQPSPQEMVKGISEKEIQGTPGEPESISQEFPNLVSLPASAIPITGEEDQLMEMVTIRKGQTIYSLTKKHYRMVNRTLMDLVLESNPDITDVHLIIVDQKIKVPKITTDLLITKPSENTYKISVGTFGTPDSTKPYSHDRALKGKKVEVIPRKISPQDTWYRVVIGDFGDKDEALNMVDYLKQKGLLPAFGGLQNSE
jgi:type II secretory pathway predicted ATPase ExeA